MAALGAQHQAHRHASHRSGTSQRQPTHNNDNAAEDIERGGRTGGRARDGHQQNARVHRHHPSAHDPPHPRARNPSCTVGARREHVLRPDSPVTCAPVGGQQAAQCMAVCPPPPRGAVRVRGGVVPRPSTPSCAGTSNCRNEGTSHSPASSCPAAGVEYFHAPTVGARKYSMPAAGDQDAGP